MSYCYRHKIINGKRYGILGYGYSETFKQRPYVVLIDGEWLVDETRWAWFCLERKGENLAKQGYKFREGHVPGVRRWSVGGGWRKYGCPIQKRASLMQEHKENYNLAFEEVPVKARTKRKAEVRILATDWDFCRYYRNDWEKGWKRSRKRKQWM